MKKILFLFCICLLVLIIVFKETYINNTIFSCNVVNKKEYNSIIKNREETNDHIVLYYKDNVIPYDKTENFYLLSTLGDNYLGKISVSKYNVVVLQENKSKQDLMNNNSSLKLLVYNHKKYKLLDLKLSNLPVMNIANSNEKSKITIFDNISDKKVKINNYNCNYHIRGASSQGATKKSYKLNILKKMVIKIRLIY